MSSRPITPGHSRQPYRVVFILLAVFTAVEVGVSYLPPLVKIPALLILAVTKASLILLYFMHLRIDNKYFALPFVLAVALVLPLVLLVVAVTPLLM
jgi:cytochrome c oxidase subunit 4